MRRDRDRDDRTQRAAAEAPSGEAWLARLQLLAEQLQATADSLLDEVRTERERRGEDA